MREPDSTLNQVGLNQDGTVYVDGDALLWMAQEVYNWAESKGWNDPPPSFGEAMMMLVTEVAEAVEAYRKWELDAMVSAWGDGVKPEGVPSEFADILIRLLHYSKLFGVDLFKEYRRKMDYNYTREYRHGGKAL